MHRAFLPSTELHNAEWVLTVHSAGTLNRCDLELFFSGGLRQYFLQICLEKFFLVSYDWKGP